MCDAAPRVSRGDSNIFVIRKDRESVNVGQETLARVESPKGSQAILAGGRNVGGYSVFARSSSIDADKSTQTGKVNSASQSFAVFARLAFRLKRTSAKNEPRRFFQGLVLLGGLYRDLPSVEFCVQGGFTGGQALANPNLQARAIPEGRSNAGRA